MLNLIKQTIKFTHVFLLGLILFGYSYRGLAQETYPNMNVKFTSSSITIDGNDLEEAWKTADSTYTGWTHFPNESTDFKNPTQLKLLYDDKNIYLMCKAFSASDDYVIPSLKWDFSGKASDKINFIFDTFSDGNIAYMFGSNMAGVKSDILISNGGVSTPRNDINRTWDAKFDVEGQIFPGYYIVEMRIPLSTLSFPKGSTSWRFNFFRFDTTEYQRTTWARIPQEFKDYNLAFMGKIHFEKPLGKSNANISVIPFINAITINNFENDTALNDLSIGGDIKVPIGNGLNLDLTYNPDFSQVEVDDEIVNLRRFEIKLPEKRQFFLQNSDLFSNFGAIRTITPFFTRRIGLARDAQGNLVENDIIGGIRLSGKISNGLKIGLLSMLTNDDVANEIPSNLNTVLSLNQKVFNRSALKFLFINRETTQDYDFVDQNDTFNRLIGLEYDLNSIDNVWNGRFFTYNSFSPLKNENGFSGGVRVKKETRKQEISFEYSYLGDDFRSDLGILRRIGVSKFCPYYAHKFYPKKGRVNYYRLAYYHWLWFKLNSSTENILENNFLASFRAIYTNQSELEIRVFNANEYFPNDFDPTGINSEAPLIGGNTYHTNIFEISYSSNPAKDFYFIAAQNYGKFYDGTKYSFENSIFFRFQPKLLASVKLNYDAIKLNHLENTAQLWLVGPKFDFSFTKKLYWATLIQFNSQSENLGVNSRLQWRFNGLSNLFLVYNDNYLVRETGPISPRMRSLNLKITYWF
jgi:hypothetical protein